MAGNTGLEPVDDGVKVRCLTDLANSQQNLFGAGEGDRTLATGLEGRGSTTELHPRENWSSRRDLNPRPSPWQGDALPLSHYCKFGAGRGT